MSLNTTSETGRIQTLRKVPTLSLGSYSQGTLADKEKFIEGLFTGIKDYGFIILKDHGVSSDLLAKAYELLESFSKLPVETKMSYVSAAGGGQRGYTPFGQEHAKDSTVMDLKEFWHVGRELPADHRMAKFYPPNIWPAEIPEFENVFSKLYASLEQAGLVMLEALSFPLQVEKNFLTDMVKSGNSILRLLHYPPIGEGVDPRCLRAAPHEDINFITILPAATASGLQLKDRDGQWLDVVSDRNTLIVDAGDMLARLTNDLIPSTTHQVVNTPEGKLKSRFSMPFFMHPHPEAMLSCLPSCRGAGAKYADITAGDFLMQRLREIGLIK
ncbi:MAG: 2-oxoglutarate and iron-dependent oxygenase domain-containing protein [Bdellovibrionota bacterium]